MEALKLVAGQKQLTEAADTELTTEMFVALQRAAETSPDTGEVV